MTVARQRPALRFGAAPLWFVSSLAVGVLVLWSIGTGAVPIDAGDLAGAVVASLGLAESPLGPMEQTVLWQLRLPRVLLGGVVGAGLAVAGALTQGLFHNPLAEPGLLGVSAGAAVGAALAIVAGSSTLGAWAGSASVAAAAFLGGLLTTGAVMRFATVHGRPDLSTMLLAGIAVNAVAGAALGLLLVVADDGQLRSITFWTLGSLAGGSWPALAVVGAATLGALGWSIRAAPSLDAMLLGHGEARLLGVEVDRVQRRAVALVALTVGTATAVCGVIGFVGLVVPHLARLLVGPSHRVMLPLSALLGAGLMVGADLLARTVVAPAELPVGLLTTLLGGPFFLGLLARSRGR